MWTPPTSPSTARPPAARPIEAVGQLSVDTMVLLDRELALGDQATAQFTRGPGGTAAIVAYNAAVLGGSVSLVGQAGSDVVDDEALHRLEEVGVTADHLIRVAAGLRVTVLVEPGGARTMISSDAPCDWAALDRDFEADAAVYFEGWPLFSGARRDAYVRLMARAADQARLVVLDACSASRPVDAAAHGRLLAELPVDVLLANETEAEAFGLLEAPPAPVVIVHRGSRSTVVATEDRRIEVHPDFIPAIDTTGAGDTFAAGLLVALQGGAGLVEAVEAGHAAARLVVRQVGPLLCSAPAPAPASLQSFGSHLEAQLVH